MTDDLHHRFPLIDERGRRLLLRLEEHPRAPRYTHRGFNRLTPAGLRRAADFAAALDSSPPRWEHERPPDWLAEFVAHCFRHVPLYRRWGPPPPRFTDLPTTDRSDLNREPWSFVPDTQPLDDLIIYNTSGVTGHPLSILTHPDTLALYIPLLRAALAARNAALEGGPDRIAIALVCDQKQTYTYAAVMPALDQAGFVKLNLNPAEWREAGDRAKFLDDLDPEIYTGDPISFAELARLPITARPKALVSTAMALTPGLRAQLETRFDCPALDLYSMNESGPIAVAAPTGDRWIPLQPRLYIEILDPDGAPTPPGARGEIVLSGGFNPFLPLLRYRTGDHAALEIIGGQPALIGLEGRAPVVFRAADGRPLNNIDISIALRPLAIAQFNLHQFADGSLRLRWRSAGAEESEVREALLAHFGATQALLIESVNAFEGKALNYTSDL